jgi:hypothetical protein
MLARLLRLRCCRILALLAALLVVGVLPHAHAETAIGTGCEQAMADSGDAPAPDKAAPGHCGLCHAVRAMLPLPEGAGAPGIVPGEALVLAMAAAPEGLPGGVPARPPRVRTIL